MAKLFDNVPRRFFNPLAAVAGGTQQQFYAECLLTLNSIFARETQAPRDDVKDAIAGIILADHIETLEGLDAPDAEKETQGLTRRKKTSENEEKNESREDALASRVIKYFADEEVGWLEEGIDRGTYSRTYMLTEQAMLLAEYLERASSMKLDEMSNYLYNTYLALDDFSRHTKEREKSGNTYTLVILNAYNNIRALYKSLRVLRRSIRRIVQTVTGKLTFPQLMDNLGDYIDGDFIGEFTRLVDSENAALFRGPITAMLRKLLGQAGTRNMFIRDCMKAGREEDLTWEQAEIRIDEQAEFIENFLIEDYASLVRDIRNQMVEYIMTVRLKLKMTMDISDNAGEVTGQFLRALAALPAGEETPEDMLAAFRILDCTYITPGSVRDGLRHRGRIAAPPQTAQYLTADEIEEEKARMRALRDVPFTREKMKAYAERYEREGIIRSADLPAATKDEVLADVAAASFAPANDMEISIDDDYIENENASIRDFTLKEKMKPAAK